MQLKSLQLYILFLVALGYQTGSCVLYKAEKPGRGKSPARLFLNRSEELENLYDRPSSIKPEHVHEVKNNSSYHFVTSSRLATATQLDISPSRASLTPLFVCILLTLCFVGAS